MIYTVTFNPALDYIMETDNVTIGATNRSKTEKIIFGGKGINVSVVLGELGIESTALGFIAGFTGAELESKLKEKGIKTDFVNLKNGITRINVKLKNECITEINANGPQITQSDLDELFSKLDKIKEGDTLVLAGSIPSSLPNDIYKIILNRLKNKKIRFVVDAEGKLLLETLEYKPFLIKPNEDELSGICGKILSTENEIVTAAKKLQEMGAVNVLVSRGSKGAILLCENGNVYKKSGRKICAANTVGAGDSMVAGFLAGVEKGYEYALCLGSAAGTATAETDGLASKENIMKYI